MTQTVWAAVGAAFGGGLGGVIGFLVADKAKPENRAPLMAGASTIGAVIGASLLSGMGKADCPACPGASLPATPASPPAPLIAPAPTTPPPRSIP